MSRDSEYTRRLERTQSRWKRRLGAQVPYRANIRRIVEGSVLDIGCGIGRNLLHLNGRGVGVDTNPDSVGVALSQGLTAYTIADFAGSPDDVENSYGTLLFAHVLEHMTNLDASALVGEYLRYLRPGGRVVFIVPQELGFRSDPTHVEPVDQPTIETIARNHGLAIEQVYSFPLPRIFGRVFKHNETVALLRSSTQPGTTKGRP